MTFNTIHVEQKVPKFCPVHFMTIKGLYPFSDKHIENDKLIQFR